MIKRTFVVALSCLLVGACASPYGRNTLIGGYSDKKIDATHYQVMFDGNGYTSKDRVWYFWFYRCAELTKEKGYAYFEMEAPYKTSWLDTNDEGAWSDAVYRPDDEAGLILAHGGGGGGGARGGGTVYYGGVSSVTTWHSNAVIGMFNWPAPPSVHVAYRAQSILDDLKPYIAANGETTPMSRDQIANRAAIVVTPPTPSF
jgi:hypothetical protein